jgi:DNA N-6-adenine-methyltransferase (Dam)
MASDLFSEGQQVALIPPNSNSLDQLRDFKIEQARATAIIEFAAKVKDWLLLGQAVDRKIEDQSEFVRWWKETVRGRGNPEIGSERLIGAERGLLEKDKAESATGITHQQVSRWRKELENVERYRERIILAACRKAGLEPEANHRAEGTGENQWFTPPEYLAAARQVMGGIDLDPATHPAAQQTIAADRFFTPKENGLLQEWHGRIWLNPPYSSLEAGVKIPFALSILSIREGDLLLSRLSDLGTPRFSPNPAYRLVNWDIHAFKLVARLDCDRLHALFRKVNRQNGHPWLDDWPRDAELLNLVDWLQPRQLEFDFIYQTIFDDIERSWRP